MEIEIYNISNIIEEFPYIAFDTEFPGIVTHLDSKIVKFKF